MQLSNVGVVKHICHLKSDCTIFLISADFQVIFKEQKKCDLLSI